METPTRIIDAHHHLWDLNSCHYPWLMAKGVKRFFGDPTPIQKNYLVTDLIDDIGDLPIVSSVHIEVGVDEEQVVDESRWLQSLAETEKGKGFPHAIIAFCDLSNENAESVLELHRQFANLRGIRQIVGRSPEEDVLTGSDKLIDNPVWIENLSKLSELGLSFDLQLIPKQLPKVTKLLKSLPDLKIALCHCGSPFDQSKSALKTWKKQLEYFAELPNTHCKISGFGMFDHHWTTESIRPVIESVIDTFSPERCMFGSNFPVDKLYSDYHSLWHSYFEITKIYSADERDRMFHHNASDFYLI